MLAGLRGLLGLSGGRYEEPIGRTRLVADRPPARLYAIGDVHGCLAELLALEQLIIADAAGADGERWIVMLGDYIDRGPASAQVLDHLIAPPPTGFRRIALAGNHEQMLLDFLAAPRRNEAWLDYGGLDTARSYGLNELALGGNPAAVARALEARMPPDHRQWISELPIALAVPGFTFVHAGLRPGIPFDRQSDEDLLWIREPFLDDLSPVTSVVVHGHTPQTEPTSTANRISIDTAAFATGRLTAVRLDDRGNISFLSTR